MLDACVVGVDLGGTHVRAGLLDQQGTILSWRETPIEARQGPQVGVERIAELIEHVLEQAPSARLIGIGVGSTGPIGREKGAIQNPYTLPGWEDVDILSPLRERFGVPLTLENDADVAALGEFWKGAGQGVKRLAMVTVGTGIGWAFVYQGAIYRGLGGFHPEGGHHILDLHGPACYCGAHGCWESLASGPAMASRAREIAAKAELPSALLEKAGGDPQAIDARLVAELAQKGDPLAERIVHQEGVYLGLGVVNIISFLLPDLILFGGGVMRMAELYLPTIREVVRTHSVVAPATQVRIDVASLGQKAGVIGAGYAIYQILSERSV